MLITINQQEIGVKTLSQLEIYAEKYFLQKENIAEQFVNHPNLFYFIPNIGQLERSIKIFPNQVEALFNRIFSDAEIWPCFLSTLFQLQKILHIFPNKHSFIFEKALANPDIFAYIVCALGNKNTVLAYFSDPKSQKVITDNYNNLTQLQKNSSYSSLDTFCSTHPDQVESLCKHLFNEKKLFLFLFRSTSDIKSICTLFPKHADLIFNSTLGNPKLFPFFVNNIFRLADACKEFPEKCTYFFSKIYLDENISHYYSLSRDQLTQFPNAFKENVHAYAELRKNTRNIYKAMVYNNSSIFFDLPLELKKLIAISSSTTKFPKEKDIKIVEKCFGRPKSR